MSEALALQQPQRRLPRPPHPQNFSNSSLMVLHGEWSTLKRSKRHSKWRGRAQGTVEAKRDRIKCHWIEDWTRGNGRDRVVPLNWRHFLRLPPRPTQSLRDACARRIGKERGRNMCHWIGDASRGIIETQKQVPTNYCRQISCTINTRQCRCVIQWN